MTAILEIPEVRQRVSRLSVEEYHRLGEVNENGRRTELLRGIVVEKMSKSPLHRSVCSRLFKMLLAQVPPGLSVWKEEPLTLRDSEPEPDISVTRGDEASFAAKHPTTAELVVEVSVSSPALDRINAEMYAEAGVKEYWIILAASRTIELYRSPVNGRYREKSTLGIDTILEPSFLPGVRVAFRELFA